jgi:hypothetical protein
VISATDINYIFNGFAYITLESNTHPSIPLDIPFNGTFTDENEKESLVSGIASIANPFPKHLDNIKVSGRIQNSMNFNGILKVNPFDVVKWKIPIKGELNFNNQQHSKAIGYILRPS